MFRDPCQKNNTTRVHHTGPISLNCSMENFIANPVFASINGVSSTDFLTNKLKIRQVGSDFLLFNSVDSSNFSSSSSPDKQTSIDPLLMLRTILRQYFIEQKTPEGVGNAFFYIEYNTSFDNENSFQFLLYNTISAQHAKNSGLSDDEQLPRTIPFKPTDDLSGRIVATWLLNILLTQCYAAKNKASAMEPRPGNQMGASM